MSATEKTHAEKPSVLLVTPQPFFEERGTPIAVRYVLKALSELGYQVDLIAFPMGRKIEIPDLQIHRVVNFLGIRSVPIGFSLRKVFLDFFLFFKIRKLLKSKQYRFIHAVEEASFLAALATRSSGAGGSKVPFIYDMASSLPEQLEDHPWIGYRPILKLVKILESWVIRRANYVVCSGGLLAHVRSVRQDVPASEWWFPSVVIDDVSEEAAKEYRKKLRLKPQERLFVYTGSFSSYQGINVLLEAIALVEKGLAEISTEASATGLDQPSARFLLAGATPEELLVVQGQWESGYPDKVTVLGRVSREEVGKMLMAADVLISPRLYGRNIPLKVFDYIGAGKPIIASNIHAHRAVLDESRAVFFENTPESLANAIIDLIRNQDKAESLGKNSLVYAKEFLTWEKFRAYIRLMVETVQKTQSAQPLSDPDDLEKKH
jgi:glycosyltransferase involved in cell wall biosynthesis